MKSLVHLHLPVVCVLAFGAIAANAQQTVTLTSTAEFQRGNNEGLISIAQNRITRDRITAGSIGGWSETTELPAGRNLPCAVAYNGFLYVIGGYEPATNYASIVVVVAPISADGSVGDWSSTTPLPSGHILFSAAAYDGFLYVMGGCDTDYNGYVDVLVAPINADGTVGSWSSTTALPATRTYHTSVAYNGFLYVIGGVDAGGYTGNVRVAQIQANGSVGGWSSTTTLPSALVYHSAVVFNNFLYVIGGFDPDSGVVSDVLVAPLNPDGTLGDWSPSSALPNPLVMHSAVADGGFVYVLGGFDADFTLRNEVWVATLNSDGTVGAWGSTSALPAARGRHRSLAINGFLYVLAGTDAAYNFFTDVLVTPIATDASNINQAPDRLRGFYSHLFDLQSDSSTWSMVINGQTSPGGVIRLQMRCASSVTGEFDSEIVVDSVALGTPIAAPATARYVWVRLTLDDTQTSDTDQPTYVSDVTVGRAPSSGFVSDGLGTDIDSQTSTTTIGANWSSFTTYGGDTIASYEWAIGTGPGLTNVQGWANVGPATSATNSFLLLSVGTTYYVRVRAVSDSGLTSVVATSDGVQVEAASGGGGGGGGGGKHCGQTATTSPGPIVALLAGLVILAGAFRMRLKRRLFS